MMVDVQSTVEKIPFCFETQAAWNSGNTTKKLCQMKYFYLNITKDQFNDLQSWFALLQRHLSNFCLLFSKFHVENSPRGHFIFPSGRAAK